MKIAKLKKGEIKLVTPYGRRGRPSREMRRQRNAELKAGYQMPEVRVPVPRKKAAPKPAIAPVVIEPVVVNGVKYLPPMRRGRPSHALLAARAAMKAQGISELPEAVRIAPVASERVVVRPVIADSRPSEKPVTDSKRHEAALRSMRKTRDQMIEWVAAGKTKQGALDTINAAIARELARAV